MLCDRCAGLTINEHCFSTQGNVLIERCLNCGSVKDSRMNLHRQCVAEGKRKDPRPPRGVTDRVVAQI